MSAAVDSFFDEYARRYTERDVEGVIDLCVFPFLAVRKGEAIHMPDRNAMRAHFASAMQAYRFAAGAATWSPVEIDALQLGENSVFATVHWNALDADGEVVQTHGRATSCSPLRTGGGSSRTRITSDPAQLEGPERIVDWSESRPLEE